MRKLATIQKVEEIKPIDGADKIEAIRINGWWLVAKKDEFKVDGICVFFEIDSLLPMIPVFSFLASKGTKKVEIIGELDKPNFIVEGYRIKTIKMKGQISQGLALPVNSFPELLDRTWAIGDDVSEELGIYKYEVAVGMNMGSASGSKFPAYISKTDEERIQNVFNKTKERFAGYSFTLTEKIDGTSCTVIRKDEEFLVCSRNLALNEPSNVDEVKSVYWQEAMRFDLRNRLPNNFAIQGEIAGAGIQSNRQGLNTRHFFVFHVYDISTGKYLPYTDMQLFLRDLKMDAVPLINPTWTFRDEYVLEDILDIANGASLLNPKALREGVVWRLNDVNQKFSFKAISNEYILKWGL